MLTLESIWRPTEKSAYAAAWTATTQCLLIQSASTR